MTAWPAGVDGVVDMHLHLDERVEGSAERAAAVLDAALDASDVERGVVLHLQCQRWSADEFASAVGKFPRLIPFVDINPLHRDATGQLRRAIDGGGFAGLKLHPRLNGFPVAHEATKALFAAAGALGVPTVIDAFPDGTALRRGFDALAYAELAASCPSARLLVAHMGGHHALDFLMLAKRIPNMFLDVSYSLLYYRGSSVPGDMVYAIRSLRGERVFYGSDYPDRSVEETLRESLALLAAGLEPALLGKVMAANARAFLDG